MRRLAALYLALDASAKTNAKFAALTVLVYAQPGSGRTASPVTDNTFAVRDAGGERVPLAKAYCGLSDEELREMDRRIRGVDARAAPASQAAEP